MLEWSEARKRMERSTRGPMGSRAYKRDVATLMGELDRRGECIKELEAQVLALTLTLRDSMQERATIMPALSSEGELKACLRHGHVECSDCEAMEHGIKMASEGEGE